MLQIRLLDDVQLNSNSNYRNMNELAQYWARGRNREPKPVPFFLNEFFIKDTSTEFGTINTNTTTTTNSSSSKENSKWN